jgi:outer membrane lipoprotein-sorting protein
MKKLQLIVCFLLIGILGVGESQSAISAKDIVKKVRKTYDDMQSIAFDFEQNAEWKLAGTSNTLQGKILIKGKDKIRIEMPDLVTVTNGEIAWSYSKSRQQVLISHAKKSDANLLPSSILLDYSEKYQATLLGEEKAGGFDCYVLELKSKTGDDFYQKMKIWVAKKNWFTQKLQQIDINQNVNTYNLSSITVDQPIADAKFIFEPPAGVETIDMRQK